MIKDASGRNIVQRKAPDVICHEKMPGKSLIAYDESDNLTAFDIYMPGFGRDHNSVLGA